MENSEYGFDRAAFDAVWHRVLTGASNDGLPNTPVKPDKKSVGSEELDRMRGFMDDEAADAATYAALASRFTGCGRKTLLGMSADERRHLKKLQARYFILTGQTYTPPGCCPFICGVGQTLRLKYAGELEGAEAYKAAALDTHDPELAEQYTSLAADETRHHQLIGGLIENMF